MMDRNKINMAVHTLLEAAPAGSEVILFGSHARGDAHDDSDLDFLIVEPGPVARMREAARLERALQDVRVHADVMVVSRETFDQWKDTPNTVIYEAAREGRFFHEVA